MALPADYTSGTITLTNGSPNFTGTGTGWLAADFREGDIILGIQDHAGQVYVVQEITSQTSGILTQDWAGASGTYQYRMRYEWDSSRVSAQTRTLIELLGNGNLQALANLTGPGVPVFNGPHAMEVRPFTDFINGVAYNVQVDTLADRAAYDGQTEGFSVLVSDMGDGRSALFSKASNASGDWTDPAYITGPVGPASTVPGVVWRGTYNAGTAYNPNDGVLYNGSSWRAKVATTGNAPPTLPTTENTQWLLLARAGIDGTGTGDFVGPAGGVTDGQLVAFDGNTGKAGKLATMPAATVKARQSGIGVGAVYDVFAIQLGIFTPPGFATADLTPAETFALLGNQFGFYKLATSTGGHIQMPPGFPQTHGVINGYLNSSNIYGYSWQEFTGHSNNQKWMRRAVNATTWGPWQEIYHRGNILGTVSQSGGVPTGAIIERGSNANGEYVRFADGTQVCTGSVVIPSATQAVGAGFITASADRQTWTYPVAFSVAPTISATYVAIDAVFANVASTSTTSSLVVLGALASRTGLTSPTVLFAVGRWF